MIVYLVTEQDGAHKKIWRVCQDIESAKTFIDLIYSNKTMRVEPVKIDYSCLEITDCGMLIKVR